MADKPFLDDPPLLRLALACLVRRIAGAGSSVIIHDGEIQQLSHMELSGRRLPESSGKGFEITLGFADDKIVALQPRGTRP